MWSMSGLLLETAVKREVSDSTIYKDIVQLWYLDTRLIVWHDSTLGTILFVRQCFHFVLVQRQSLLRCVRAIQRTSSRLTRTRAM